jgi:hypothetical protein
MLEYGNSSRGYQVCDVRNYCKTWVKVCTSSVVIQDSAKIKITERNTDGEG